MSEPMSLPLRIVQVLGISISAFTAGLNFAHTTIFIPSMLILPTPLMLKAWRRSFVLGRATVPPFAVGGALSFFYLAYRAAYSWPLTTPPPNARLLNAAGIVDLALLPFTFFFMQQGVNKRLNAGAAKAEAEADSVTVSEAETKSARQDVDLWGTLNLTRSMFPLAGAMIGAWALLF